MCDRDPPICEFFPKNRQTIRHGEPRHPAEPIGRARVIREHAQSRFLHHQPFIQPDNMKWRFPGQCAPAILDGTAQADIVRALTLCRIMRGGDNVRQTKKRLIDPEFSVACRFNPPGIDAGSEARVPD